MINKLDSIQSYYHYISNCCSEFFVNECVNPTEVFAQPITKDIENTVSQSKLEVITCSRREARENVHERVMVGFISMIR